MAFSDSDLEAYLKEKEDELMKSYVRAKIGAPAQFIGQLVSSSEDNVRRLASETGAAAYDALEGISKMPQAFGNIYLEGLGNEAKIGQSSVGIRPEEAAAFVAQSKKGLAETALMRGLEASAKSNRELAEFTRSPSAYAIDRSRDSALTAQVAGGLGSLPVAIASGPAAPAVVAGMMGAQGARDARESLERRGITDPAEIQRAEDEALLANAALGLVSEPLLGAPAMLKSVRGAGAGLLAKAGVRPATTATGRAAQSLVKGTVREAAQEGPVEQFGANVVAKDLVGYDPERDRTEGVLKSAVLGGLIGGPTSAAFQISQDRDSAAANQALAARLDTAQNIPESVKTLLLQQDQLRRGLRPAQMFPKGTEELSLPEQMERIETDRGIFHYNPAQVSRQQILAASARGEENLILGLGPVSKPAAEARAAATGEPLVVTTERAADGTEIKSAVGTTGTAAAQAAALEAGKSPGSTISTTTPRQTIVERQLAAQAQAAAAARASLEKEQAERTERQAVMDAKKERIEQTMVLAREWATDPEVDLPKLKAAVTSLDSGINDIGIGLTLEQRNQAAALRKRLTPRYEELLKAEDVAVQKRRLESQAKLKAEEAKLKAARKAEVEAINAIKTTGRDPREGNVIVELANVPDEEFYGLENNLDAEGLDINTWQEELNRRMKEAERTDDSAMPNITLADVFTGANGAKKWLGKTLRIKPASTLREDGDPLAGDMAIVQEDLPIGWLDKNGMTLEAAVEALRGYGFNFQVPSDLLEALRSPEDVRPSQAGQEIDYAEREDGPLPYTIMRSDLVESLVLNDMERSAAQQWVREFTAMPGVDAFNALSRQPMTPASTQRFMRFWRERNPNASETIGPAAEPAPTTRYGYGLRPGPEGAEGQLWLSELYSDGTHRAIVAVGTYAQPVAAYNRAVSRMQLTNRPLDLLEPKGYGPPPARPTARSTEAIEATPEEEAMIANRLRGEGRPAPRYDYSIKEFDSGSSGKGWYIFDQGAGQVTYLGDGSNGMASLRTDAINAIFKAEADSEAYADLPSDEVRRRIGKRIAPLPSSNSSPAPAPDSTVVSDAIEALAALNQGVPAREITEMMREIATMTGANFTTFTSYLNAIGATEAQKLVIANAYAAVRQRPELIPSAGRVPSTPAPAPTPAPAQPAPADIPRSALVRVGSFFKKVAAQASAWQLGPTPTSKDVADIAKAYSTKKVRILSEPMGNGYKLQTFDEAGNRIGYITFYEEFDSGIIFVGATEAKSNKESDRGGKQMYQTIFTWAHNNGKIVEGSGLSAINQVRRTVNMLSSALRHNTTKHLKPYSTQDISRWIVGDTENNIGAMVLALSRKLSVLTNRRLDALTYDVKTDSVVDNVTGQPLSPAELGRIVDTDKLFEKGFGIATVRAILAGRAQLAAYARGQRLDAKASRQAAVSGSLRGVLYAERALRGGPPARRGADAASQAEPTRDLLAAAPTATSWRDIPRLRTDAEVDAEIEGIRAILPRLANILDLKVGDISELLSQARRRRINAPASVEAAVTTDLETERLLIALSARAAEEGSLGSLFLHEIGHKYWDVLPDYAKDYLRQLHERETSSRTGPLFNTDEGRTKRTKIKILKEEFSAERLAQDEDLAVKEWFCERIAAMNREWLAGRMPSGAPLLLRIWRQFTDFLAATFAGVQKLDPDSEVFKRSFRQWLKAGDISTADTATAYARGERGRAQFATTQGTMDLGGMALGLDLPDTIRNLTPRYQDKTVRFESNLDKALYYAGGEGQTATKTAITEHIQRETGLAAGEIATLARELRRKMAPLSRSTARDGTMRIGPQMQAEARRLTGVDFAAAARRNDKTLILTPEQQAKTVPVIVSDQSSLTATRAADLRRQARAVADAWLNKPVINTDTGESITITKDSLSHAYTHQGLQHIRIIPALPALLRTARKLTSEPHEPPLPGIKTVHRYAAAVQITGRLYRVKLTVKERLDGLRVYDHEATEIAAPESKSSRDPRSEGIAGPSPGALMTVAELFPEYKTEADGSREVEFAEREAEFAKAFDEAAEDFYQSARDSVSTDPQRVSAEDKATRNGEILTLDQAAARVQEWKDLAAKEGKTGKNQQKTILSLFDSTGVWSRPWREAGFNVVQIDQKIVGGDGYEMDVMNVDQEWLMDNGLDMVHGVLAACPCTEFAGSGARWFKIKDANGRTNKAAQLVNHTLAVIEYLQPEGFWAIENPIGRIKQETEIPTERLQFQPHNYGDPYTKRTQIFGSFNANLPQANVEPTGGSFSWNLSGNRENSKAERSKTFEGFAYAFFAANHTRDGLAEAEASTRREIEQDRAYRERGRPEEITGEQTDIQFAEREDTPVLTRLAAKRTDLTPTDEDKRVAAKWLAVMPAFQGGKYQMAEPAARIIREKFTTAQREQIETVVDYFGGGGMWGGYLALTHFPNAKRLVVYELEGYRAEKIRAFLTEADRMPQAFARPEVKAILDSVVAQATADGTTSGSALAARLKDRYRSQTDPQIKSLLGALIDAQMSARGRAVDDSGQKTAEASMEKLTNLVIRDATDAAKGASALRARGVQVEVRNENSYASQPVSGDRVLSVMDPPYYLTTGYLGEIVGIDIYRQTDQLLRRNATTGNAILYTDAAWHLDHPERFQTQDELIQVTPEDHERLANIVDSINALGTVGLEGRNEILGINLPGHTAGASTANARAKGDRPDSNQASAGRGPARSDRPRGAQERGLDPSPNAPDNMAGQGQDGPRADRDGAGSADRGTRREQLKAALPPGVTTGSALSAEQEAEAQHLSEAARVTRHPAAVGDVEPTAAWASVAKLTEPQLAEQIRNIDTFLSDNFLDLADASKAHLQSIRAATKMELDRRQAEAAAKSKTAAPAAPAMPKPDRKAALVAQWKQGKLLRAQANINGNQIAEDEAQHQVSSAKRALDDEYPEWEAEQVTPPQGRPQNPRTDRAAAAPAPAPVPGRARADQVAQDDGRNLATPPPPEPPEKGAPPADEPAPDRGRAHDAFGHTAATPAWWERSWAKAREVLVGFRGAIPELQAFPDTTDRFVREYGKMFYNGLKAFYRTLASANDFVQRTAEEQVAGVTEPLMRLGGRFDADAYKQIQRRQEQARRAVAEGQPMPAGAKAELDALNLRLQSHPYYLFNRLVYFMDLDWRYRNLKDSEGNPIKQPLGLNETEIRNELKALGDAIAASPHADAIEAAYEKHVALVKQISEDLKGRDLFAAEALANPVYFPHITLEVRQGDKVVQRELRPERVRVGVEADFRGYLQDPIGSAKPIESDYVRAMYYHLVQVGAHNLKADAVRDHVRPYNIMTEVEATAKEMSRTRPYTVSWEQAFHEVYEPRGYVLYGTDSRDAFPSVNVDREKLARRLGVVLTGEDLQKQLAAMGLKGIQLLPEDLKETLMQGQREMWVVPARVAEALRGIADRQTQKDDPISAALKTANGWWKAWKLFMPQNHIRYEYGNVVADLEKIFSSSPRTFRKLPQAAKEMRAFFNGEVPSEDLRAALKDGVINAITAQEMQQLQRLRAFEKFQTKTERALLQTRKRASSLLYQPLTNFIGLGDLSSVELSAFREGVTRYANYLSNLEAIRNGARPDYAGAYHRDIEALQESRPGAGDRAQRQAAQISKATFGDYADLSVTGQWLRDHMIPFYSWMEVNFKYHANLFRNNLDLVRGQGTTGKGLTATAAQGSALAGAFVARLAIPYVMLALYNATMSGVDDDELSEEDRRRIHLRLGHTEDGKPIVIYGATALADVMKWVSGAKMAQAGMSWVAGKTDFATAFNTWASEIPGDFANNTLGSTGPLVKIGTALTLKKSTFPDVLDAKTIPDYDLRRNIIGQMTDDFTADQLERIVNKDYAAPKDYGVWAKQLILQMRQRDPESWAFYSIKDKAAAYVETRTGQSRDSSYNAPDQQVLRNFRRAIYQGEPEQAAKFYLRLLELGYTSERFAASIRAQDPLSALPKESGLRREFVASLRPDEQAQLKRAYAYYTRLSAERGAEGGLFPSKRFGERGQQAFEARPRLDLLNQTMQRRDQMTEREVLRQAAVELQKSLAGPN